jgi:hypothetical protein
MLQEVGLDAKPPLQPNTSRAGTGGQSRPPTKRRRILHLGKQAVKRIAIWTVALVTLTGVGFWQLRPKISIEPYASLNLHVPFAQLFSIQNQSLYGILDVSPRCGVNAVESNVGLSGAFTFVNMADAVAYLAPNTKTNATCRLDTLLGTAREYPRLSIDIWVVYKLPLLGIYRCDSAKFKGVKSADGTFIWTYDGASDCPATPLSSN